MRTNQQLVVNGLVEIGDKIESIDKRQTSLEHAIYDLIASGGNNGGVSDGMFQIVTYDQSKNGNFADYLKPLFNKIGINITHDSGFNAEFIFADSEVWDFMVVVMSKATLGLSDGYSSSRSAIFTDKFKSTFIDEGNLTYCSSILGITAVGYTQDCYSESSKAISLPSRPSATYLFYFIKK